MSTPQYGYQPVSVHTYDHYNQSRDGRPPQQIPYDGTYEDDDLQPMRGPPSYTPIGRTSSFNSQYSHGSAEYNNRTHSPNSPGTFPLVEVKNPTLVYSPSSYQTQRNSVDGRTSYDDGFARQQQLQGFHGVAGVAPADLPVTTGRGVDYQSNMYIEGNKAPTTKKCCRCNCCTCTCSKSCWKKTAIIFFVTILVIAFLLFLAVWVVFPLVFMNTYSLQRFLIFLNIDQPEDPEYTNFDKYDAVGVRNFYVDVIDYCCPGEEKVRKLKLGTWQVVPEDEIQRARKYNEADFINSLQNSKKPIIIYLHGQSGTRIFFYNTYKVLRKFFHVLAFDYRGYADSTGADITETNVVRDSVQFYEWVVNNTRQENIYIWGHSLGTALATHALKEIYRSDKKLLKPKGLILEAPFTTMREEISYIPLAKYWRWLVYFEQTFQDPVEDNGFLFRTVENIKHVDCPVMVIHAEDDWMIPYHLGKKVYEVAYNNRTNTRSNKKAIFKLVPANIRANHMAIYKDPQLPSYIREFLMMAPTDSRGLMSAKMGG